MTQKHHSLDVNPIAVPIGLKHHFDNPTSAVHEPQANFQYFDPSHPGHDFFNDPEPSKVGLLARILRR